MQLGESIYRQRTAHNMSQGDLADALEVSRQSVSKWENNMAVPELDKLLKMSELFGVTLDELVHGETGTDEAAAPPEIPTAPAPAEQKTPAETPFPPRKIVGTILLCMGFLVFLLLTVLGEFPGGLMIASPFLLCGAICFLFRRTVGLWCAWTIYFLVDAYMQWGTGARRSVIWLTFVYEASWNYTILIVSWILVLILLTLITLTVLRFRHTPFSLTRPQFLRLIVGWLTYVLLGIAPRIPYALLNTSERAVLSLLSAMSFAADWLRIGLFTVLAVFTAAAVRAWRVHRKENEKA